MEEQEIGLNESEVVTEALAQDPQEATPEEVLAEEAVDVA